MFAWHGARHAAAPVIAISGWSFGYLMSGAVVVETLVARPGIGRLIVEAVLARDLPLASGVVVVVALCYVMVVALTDQLGRVVAPLPESEARRASA